MNLTEKLKRKIFWRKYRSREVFEYKYEKRPNAKSIDCSADNALSVFVGGLAHDMNNLLTAVIGHAELALSNLGEDDNLDNQTVRRQLQNIHLAGSQMGDITNELLTFAGLGRREIELVRLDSIVREKLDIEQLCLRKNIALIYKREKSLPQITADREELLRVIDSLVSNSRDAIGNNHGRIEISLNSINALDIDEKNLVDPSYLRKAASYLVFEIKDTGVGMPEEVKQRMFEPFFTTKFIGRGLGLAAVQGIVRAHGWGISVESSLNAGTVVKLYFPVSGNTKDSDESQSNTKKRNRYFAKGGSSSEIRINRVRYGNGLLQRNILSSSGLSTTH